MSDDCLDEDLDAGARRRLWFLRAALERRPDPEAALRLAAQMERFVIRGRAGASQERKEEGALAIPPPDGSACGAEGQERSAVLPEKPATTVSLGNATAAEPGPSVSPPNGGGNTGGAEELARATSGHEGAPHQSLQRLSEVVEAEGVQPAMEGAKPRGRPPQPRTLEDIVRFLRQQGDVVLSAEGDAYRVNGSLVLTPDELVARANRIRRRLGKAPFPTAAAD